MKIARDLVEQTWRAHRLRTNLMHEYGHLWLHAQLRRTGSLAAATRACRESEIAAPEPVDWMEWQSNYAAGALLMPRTRFKLLVRAYFSDREVAPIPADSSEAVDLKERTGEAFDVSEDAAAVRLSQLSRL